MVGLVGRIILAIGGLFTTMIVAFFMALLSSIVLYFLWNFFAPTYFSFLPPVWLALPFWHVVGLMWCLGLIRNVIMPSASASATATSG